MLCEVNCNAPNGYSSSEITLWGLGSKQVCGWICISSPPEGFALAASGC